MSVIANFLVTELIWSITFGLYHLVVSFLLLFLFLKLWDHIRTIRALWLSAYFVMGAFMIFFIIVGGILMRGFGIPYALPEDTYQGTYSYLTTSILLGVVYAGLQTLLLIGLSYVVRINMPRIFLCIVFANLLAALLVYKFSFII